jgi:hypothetical protein
VPEAVTVPEAVVVKVTDVSGAVQITDLSGSIKEVMMQELAKTPVTDVSGIPVLLEVPTSESANTEVTTISSVTENATPLTPEQAKSPGLFLDWAMSAKNDPSIQRL